MSERTGERETAGEREINNGPMQRISGSTGGGGGADERQRHGGGEG